MKQAIAAAALTLALALGACSGGPEPQTGTYAMTEQPFSSLALEEGNAFRLDGPPEISLVLTGSYELRNGSLFLSGDVEGLGEHVFSVQGETLVFERGPWLEHWVEPGAEFHRVET